MLIVWKQYAMSDSLQVVSLVDLKKKIYAPFSLYEMLSRLNVGQTVIK